ncbi:MAG: DNA-directed DNA polymerase eta rad30, partial [Watsoniomyces obsoletus]
MAGSKAPVTPTKGAKKATQKPHIAIADVKEFFDIEGQPYANLRKDIGFMMREHGVTTLKDAGRKKWDELLDAALKLPALASVKKKTRNELEAARQHMSFLVSDISKKQRESKKKGSAALKGKKRDHDDFDDDDDEDDEELDDVEEALEKENFRPPPPKKTKTASEP